MADGFIVAGGRGMFGEFMPWGEEIYGTKEDAFEALVLACDDPGTWSIYELTQVEEAQNG